MARLKANVGGHWVTGENAQQLVNNAIEKQRKASGAPTVKAYAEDYIKLYKQGKIEQNTLVGYRGYLKNHIVPAMGDMRINEITVSIVQEYINAKAEKLTAKTIKEHIGFMASVFDGAVEDEIIPRNPFRSKRIEIKGRKSEKVRAITEDEYSQFEREVLPCLTGSTQLYAAITLYTGMRQGEICALRWENIDFESKRIRLRKSIAWASKNKGDVKDPKTENGKRDPVIMPQLMPILKAHAQPSGYLIRGQRSKDNTPASHETMTRLNERIKKAEAAAGMEHVFGNRRGRHTIATLMNNADIDSKTIENQLGHYSAAFTSRQYMDSQAKQVERSMEKLSAYIGQI